MLFFLSKRFVTLKVKWRNSARRIFSALPFISGTPDTSQLSTVSGNGVNLNDTLESSTILIYSNEHMSLYTQGLGSTPKLLNGRLKVIEGSSGAVNKVNLKGAVAEEVGSKSYSKIFFANAKLY
jgi:hypothetical protein